MVTSSEGGGGIVAPRQSIRSIGRRTRRHSEKGPPSGVRSVPLLFVDVCDVTVVDVMMMLKTWPAWARWSRAGLRDGSYGAKVIAISNSSSITKYVRDDLSRVYIFVPSLVRSFVRPSLLFGFAASCGGRVASCARLNAAAPRRHTQ